MFIPASPPRDGASRRPNRRTLRAAATLPPCLQLVRPRGLVQVERLTPPALLGRVRGGPAAGGEDKGGYKYDDGADEQEISTGDCPEKQRPDDDREERPHHHLAHIDARK